MISIQRWAVAMGAIVLTALCFAACGGKEETPAQSAREKALDAIPPEQRPQIETGEEGGIRYEGKTEEGEKFLAQLGGAVTLPKSFPKDIPLFPDSVLSSSLDSDDGPIIVGADSDKQPPEIYAFYKEQLPAAGWRIENDVNVGGQRVLSAVKGDRKAVIDIEGTETGARFGFVVSQ